MWSLLRPTHYYNHLLSDPKVVLIMELYCRSYLAGSVVSALVPLQCSQGLITEINKWDDLWSPHGTSGVSLSAPVFCHSKSAEMPWSLSARQTYTKWSSPAFLFTSCKIKFKLIKTCYCLPFKVSVFWGKCVKYLKVCLTGGIRLNDTMPQNNPLWGFFIMEFLENKECTPMFLGALPNSLLLSYILFYVDGNPLYLIPLLLVHSYRHSHFSEKGWL